MKVELREILSAMEFSNSENASYLNIKNGEVILLSESDISAVEDDNDIEDYPEWQMGTIAIAKEILINKNKDYIPLPDDFEIDEYHMMQRFIGTISNDNLVQTLSISIKGSGAFRRFKEHLYQFEIQDKWFAYRDNEYKQLAIQWCHDNNVEYIDE